MLMALRRKSAPYVRPRAAPRGVLPGNPGRTPPLVGLAAFAWTSDLPHSRRRPLVTQRTSQAHSGPVCQAQHHPNTAFWLAQTLPTRGSPPC